MRIQFTYLPFQKVHKSRKSTENAGNKKTIRTFYMASFDLVFEMESSKNIKKFTCEICSKEFSSNHYKKQHITIVHEEVKKFLCNVCNKNLDTKIS